MIEQELFSHLLTKVTLVNERVYPSLMPQDCLKPALVYSITNDADTQGFNGGLTGFKVRVQIDCYSTSYAEVKELKNAVKAALYSFIYYPHGLNTRDNYEEDVQLHRQLIDFSLKG
ncbi:MAG: hypothetical protein COA44_06185 [Arcobacter sp.]|nr:MAG: hypothetical protein COA44_06185 [Arcobacter sp.]